MSVLEAFLYLLMTIFPTLSLFVCDVKQRWDCFTASATSQMSPSHFSRQRGLFLERCCWDPGCLLGHGPPGDRWPASPERRRRRTCPTHTLRPPLCGRPGGCGGVFPNCGGWTVCRRTCCSILRCPLARVHHHASSATRSHRTGHAEYQQSISPPAGRCLSVCCCCSRRCMLPAAGCAPAKKKVPTSTAAARYGVSLTSNTPFSPPPPDRHT
eukprot:COSAG01_NODE_280_length_19520_cov_9.720406_7_plen_212_part_00